MYLKWICCDVLTRIACKLTAESKNIIDIEFVKMLAHIKPEQLRAELQERIDRSVKEREYDALLLGYGICGNATAGLTCKIPMVIPRVHDCCAMFMGSTERFVKEFGSAPSTRWCSNGYYERSYADPNYKDDITQMEFYKTGKEYIDLLEKYGEENAEYVWSTLHPKIETDEAVYIELDGFEYSGSREFFGREVEKQGKKLIMKQGDISMLRKMAEGQWDEKDFLVVQPGRTVTPVYDMREVIAAQ